MSKIQNIKSLGLEKYGIIDSWVNMLPSTFNLKLNIFVIIFLLGACSDPISEDNSSNTSKNDLITINIYEKIETDWSLIWSMEYELKDTVHLRTSNALKTTLTLENSYPTWTFNYPGAVILFRKKATSISYSLFQQRTGGGWSGYPQNESHFHFLLEASPDTSVEMEYTLNAWNDSTGYTFIASYDLTSTEYLFPFNKLIYLNFDSIGIAQSNNLHKVEVIRPTYDWTSQQSLIIVRESTTKMFETGSSWQDYDKFEEWDNFNIGEMYFGHIEY